MSNTSSVTLEQKNNSDIQNNDAVSPPTIAKPLLADALPPIGVVVEAKCRCSRDWPKALGGTKVFEETKYIRRIKTTSNSLGWQWSDPEIETYFTWDVVSWRFC